MLELRLDDPHLVENFQAVLNLKKMGFADDELQRLYQKQLEEDAYEIKRPPQSWCYVEAMEDE